MTLTFWFRKYYFHLLVTLIFVCFGKLVQQQRNTVSYLNQRDVLPNKDVRSAEETKIGSIISKFLKDTKPSSQQLKQSEPEIKPSSRQPIWNNPHENPDFFIPRKNIVNPMNFDLVTRPNWNCSKDPPFLTVLVLSLHEHAEYRQSIRDTWGSLAYNKPWPHVNVSEKVMVTFLMGSSKDSTLNEKVKMEAEQTGDIVMYDFADSYFNLTYKVLSGFKWVRDYCPQSKFILKVDEDTFVDIPQVIKRLHSPEWDDKISGSLCVGHSVFRTSKYAVIPSAYPFNIYPPHVKGNIYFMPTSIAVKLFNVSYYMPYVNMEDSYVTGILPKTIGDIKFKGLLSQSYSRNTVYKGCSFIHPPRVASQGISPADARDIWRKMTDESICRT